MVFFNFLLPLCLVSIGVVHGQDACVDDEDCNTENCRPSEEACDVPYDAITNPGKRMLNQASSPVPIVEYFCNKFNEDSHLEGFMPCPGYFDNVKVRISTDSGITASDPDTNDIDGSYFLHVLDTSGASLACGVEGEYVGDWSHLKCHELCYQMRVLYDGCHSGMSDCMTSATGEKYVEINPTIILQGSGPNFHRAVFKPSVTVTDDKGPNPGWHKFCAPLGPLKDDGSLPSNAIGEWHMASSVDILSGAPPTGTPVIPPNSAWPVLLSHVTAIQLPIDFTSNPAERVGYDNICLQELICEDRCDPEPLCYWQYEWDCENLKKEPWYPHFIDLIDKPTGNPTPPPILPPTGQPIQTEPPYETKPPSMRPSPKPNQTEPPFETEPPIPKPTPKPFPITAPLQTIGPAIVAPIKNPAIIAPAFISEKKIPADAPVSARKRKDSPNDRKNLQDVEPIEFPSVKTFSNHTCVCKLLSECCPDRCMMAEQEFMALLLNIASEKLHLSCCVKHCPWKKINLARVVYYVDNLLFPSSRTDYDCSQALELLTGINQDVILCDSESK